MQHVNNVSFSESKFPQYKKKLSLRLGLIRQYCVDSLYMCIQPSLCDRFFISAKHNVLFTIYLLVYLFQGICITQISYTEDDSWVTRACSRLTVSYKGK